MALKPCVGCRQLIRSGSRCQACKLRRPAGNQWAPVRRYVLLRDNHRCQACGGPGGVVDHIEPIARGGTDTLSNLQALCVACNAAKGAR